MRDDEAFVSSAVEAALFFELGPCGDPEFFELLEFLPAPEFAEFPGLFWESDDVVFWAEELPPGPFAWPFNCEWFTRLWCTGWTTGAAGMTMLLATADCSVNDIAVSTIAAALPPELLEPTKYSTLIFGI